MDPPLRCRTIRRDSSSVLNEEPWLWAPIVDLGPSAGRRANKNITQQNPSPDLDREKKEKKTAVHSFSRSISRMIRIFGH